MTLESGWLVSDDGDVVVRTARRTWRCTCADQVWRYAVRGEYDGGGWSETYASTPAEADTARSTRQARIGRRDGRLRVLSRVTVTEVANPGYRPDCLGDIAVGDRHVEYTGEAGPGGAGTRYCARCAVALWEGVRLVTAGAGTAEHEAAALLVPGPPATRGGSAFVYDDGGRAAAGFKGDAEDCFTRAIAIATGLGYRDVYDAVNILAKDERVTKRRKKRSSARTGVHKGTLRRFMADLGWTWVPAMQIGQGCTVHLRADELPPGRLVVKVSRHCVAVVDGQVHDTHDPSRDGTRCVYGYFTKQSGPGSAVPPSVSPAAVEKAGQLASSTSADSTPGRGTAIVAEGAIVTFSLAGAGYQVAASGNWPHDNRRGWAALLRAPSRRVGKGCQLDVAMRVDDAQDLAAYLLSVAEINEVMTAEERGASGTSDARAARLAIARIEAALKVRVP